MTFLSVGASGCDFKPSVLLLNARSLALKLDELHVLCCSIRPRIIVITESWLTSSILNEQIVLPNFGAPFRFDRADGRKGGGVCIYVNNDLACTPISDSNLVNQKYESIFLSIPVLNMFLLAMYIPPGLTKLQHDNITQNVKDSIEAVLSDSPSAKLLACGDFNDFPTDFFETEFSLNQVVTQPTRENAILDKIFLDDVLREHYDPPIVGPNLSSSDHRTVFLPAIRAKPVLVREKKVYDYRESHIAQFVCS